MRRHLLTVGVVVAVAAGFWLGAASCGKGGGASGPAEREASNEREILFPADLGPDKIDVTSYPVSQQDNYRLFVEKCSGCHTLARAVNSPIVDASTWGRFVKRMHSQNRARNGGELLSGVEAKRVTAFLVYDSRERKVKRAEEFQTLQAGLRVRFDREVRERLKKKEREGRAHARESTPYVGDR